MLSGGAPVPEVVINPLKGQKLRMAAALSHPTSLQHKYPGSRSVDTHCFDRIQPVRLHDSGEPVSDRYRGPTLLGHLQRLLHHLSLSTLVITNGLHVDDERKTVKSECLSHVPHSHLLALGVESRGGLVEEQHRRVSHLRAIILLLLGCNPISRCIWCSVRVFYTGCLFSLQSKFWLFMGFSI